MTEETVKPSAFPSPPDASPSSQNVRFLHSCGEWEAWIDEGTGIYWLQCLAGQCLVDDACAWEGGEAVTFEYDEAVAACPGGTRLPTIEELMGLLGDCDEIDFGTNMTGFCNTCAGSPACDAIYPGTEELELTSTEAVHWSSTALNDSKMWRINFLSGLVDATLKEMSGTAVCVRSE